MPKKQNPLTPEEQRERFEKEVERLKAAGDFDRDAADAAVDKLVRKAKTKPSS